MSLESNHILPLISVAMTTYNGARYLQAQLDSIYAQSYPHIEVVVCDDGSTDETIPILKRYEAEKGLRLYCNASNLGYVQNFYKAASLCAGDYIAFADQDDTWCPDKLAVLHQALGEKGLLVYSDSTLVDGRDAEFSPSRYAHIIGVDNPGDIRLTELRESYIIGCTMMMKASLLTMAQPFPPSHLGGHDNWFPFIAKTLGQLVYVDKPLMRYRVHDHNASCRIAKKGWLPLLKKCFKQRNVMLFFRLRQFFYRFKSQEIRAFQRSHPFLRQYKAAAGTANPSST